MENENMKLWSIWANVPEEAGRDFNNGSFAGTDINPTWRIQMLTEVFGPCGFGWYYTIDKQWTEEVGNETKAFTNITLYVKKDGEWSMGIQGTGGNWFAKTTSKGVRVSDECYKMSLTDAIGVACHRLGIGANVYFADGKSKYTMKDDETGTLITRSDVAGRAISEAKSVEELKSIYTEFADMQKDKTFLTALTIKKNELSQAS